MRNIICLTILVIAILYLPNSDAQESIQWNLPVGAKARLSKGAITDMQLSPDGTQLAVASSTGVRIYDVNTGEENVILRKVNDLNGLLTFSPDGTTLVHTTGEKKCYVWNVENRKLLNTFNCNDSSFKSLKLLEDEKSLVILNWKAAFSFWDISTGELLETTGPKASKIRIKWDVWHRAIDSVVDDTGSVTYAIANHDGTVGIQDGRTHKLIRTLVPQTNEDAFLKVGQKQEPIVIRAIPPGLINENMQKHIPSNFRDDGKPFPIQYNLNPQNSFHATLDKQPMKWIDSLKFSPEGKLLVSKSSYKIPRWNGASGTSGPTELWDVETGEQLAALPWWVDVVFSSDSNTIAILRDRSIGGGHCDIWDLSDFQGIAQFESISDVKFSQDGKTFVLVRSGQYDLRTKTDLIERSYAVWDIAKQKEIASLDPIDDKVMTLLKNRLFSKDGSLLIAADQIGTVEIWNTKTDMQMHTLTAGYTNKFNALAFSDDGKTLVSGSSGRIHLWDTDSGTLRHTISTENVDIEGITFTKDNKKLTTIGFGSTIQWDVSKGKQITSNITRIRLDATVGSSSFGDGTRITHSTYAISPNSKVVAAKNRKENGIEIWNTGTRKRIGVLTDDVFRTARGAMALIPDGSILATVDLFGKEQEVYLWDTDTGERMATLNVTKNFIEKVLTGFMDMQTNALMFDFSGETLAVGIDNKDIQMWDVDTQKRVRIIKTRHKYAICKLAFSPDGNYVTSGDTGGNIQVWDTKTGKNVAKYKGHKGNINVLVFSKNSNYLASTGLYDGTIYLWEVPEE